MTAAVLICRTAAMEPAEKKPKLDLFSVKTSTVRTLEEIQAAYEEAIKAHPFYDNAHSIVDLYDDATIRDGRGVTVGVVLRNALPSFAATLASDVLRTAAVRTSLRSTIYGGLAPFSGIAGYYDYRGAAIEFKYRKTSFTYEHAKDWWKVLPMVDYVSEIYRHVMPEKWANQDAAIPDVVRIHGSPYSTLTINSRFRTATHTDAGDFDAGYSCISCLEGQFKGLALSFDDFHVNVLLQPRDVLIFDSHHFHSNTEIETIWSADDWSRLTCVFYYRSPLGERRSYEEYKRRLAAARADASIKLPLKSIVEKENGENLNRPSPVYPVKLSPFAALTTLHCLQHCASHAAFLHDILMESSTDVSTLLFGEPLQTRDGIPLRGEDEKRPANEELLERVSLNHCGLQEHGTVLKAMEGKELYLNTAFLSEWISAPLLQMWTEARSTWLKLVAKEWERLLKIKKSRCDFVWNNHSEMNTAFFDLCEVAKQVMLGLLNTENANRSQEVIFWTLYGTHLHKACTEELGMPEEAMSLRKLNVKLKDFNFGGTRYFKDMPETEQERRLERKRRIEEARLHRAPEDVDRISHNWLLNDSFDYQTEDSKVNYVENNWPLPCEHATAVTSCIPRSAVDASSLGATEVNVLVVIPRYTASTVETIDFDALDAKHRTSTEWMRLSGCPAVQRCRTAAQRNTTLPHNFSIEKLQVHYCFHDGLPSACFDFVVLQHVLSIFHDDAKAQRYLQDALERCRGCLFLTETDVQCRQYYTLREQLRLDYDAVAPSFFQSLHQSCYGTVDACTRTKEELELLVPTKCCARVKLQGSPLNTTVLLVSPA